MRCFIVGGSDLVNDQGEIAGVVVEIAVAPGDSIREGDVIAVIEAS